MPFGFGDNPPGTPDPTSFFDGIIAAIYDALVFLYNLIVSVLVFLYNLLVALVNILVQLFKTISSFLKTVWENYIKPGINWLLTHVQKVRDWLKRTLKPVLAFFQRLKRWYDTHVLAQQLRVLRMIQTIRRFLSILRIFHIHWADKLDQALADVQNRIQQSIAFVRGILNQVINTLALVFDPTLFVSRHVLGGTLLGNLGALKRIMGFGDNRLLSPDEANTLDRDRTRYFASNTAAYMAVPLSAGLTDEDKAMIAAAQQALNDATGQT